MSFSLSQLTEGIQARNIGTGNRRLLEKWGRTGLLRGLEGVKRENMATMLENQAGQALREASNLGAGDSANASIRGFTNIAFPIVRRVFAIGIVDLREEHRQSFEGDVAQLGGDEQGRPCL